MTVMSVENYLQRDVMFCCSKCRIFGLWNLAMTVKALSHFEQGQPWNVPPLDIVTSVPVIWQSC